jgi:hypothetical protein
MIVFELQYMIAIAVHVSREKMLSGRICS